MDQRHARIEALIARTALGERSAFDALYDATSAKLLSVCLSVLKDRPEAEEALQESFIRVWNHAGRYTVNGLSPMTWLITIARNCSIDRLRRRKGGPAPASQDLADSVASSAPGPEEQTIMEQQRDRLQTCLEEIGEPHADAVRAVYLEGASYADLAKAADAPLNTVRSWLRRGLLQLKDCVSQ